LQLPAAVRHATGDAIEHVRIGAPKGFLDRLAAVAPACTIPPRMHSVALRFAHVVDGTFDAAIAGHSTRDWDLAAADLLVHEAGGTLTTTIEGTTNGYNGATTAPDAVVAACPPPSFNRLATELA